MAQPMRKPILEDDGPGSRSFTTGLIAAFRTQVRTEVQNAQAQGVLVVGLDPNGQRVELPPETDLELAQGSRWHERIGEASS